MADIRRVGCCRAAVDSEGFTHDHAEWYRDLQAAHIELDILRQQLSDLRALKDGEAGEWQRLVTDRDTLLAAAIRVVQLAELDNTAGTYKAIAELRKVLDERGGGQ